MIARGAEAWLANAHGVLVSDDPEFVHQARVALRRMRSALRLWGAVAAFPPSLATEVEWIADVLGAARDADVLATALLPSLAALLPPRPAAALRRLLPTMARRRAAVRAQARLALASGRCAQLALALLQWGASPAAPGPTRSAAAQRRLRRARRQVTAAARDFDALPAAQRHRLRRRLKRYRDALELLDGALPAKAAARALRPLTRLQDLLGALADARLVDDALAALGAGAALRRRVAAAQRQASAPQAAAALRKLRRLRAAAARLA